jgi:hypothetical protein
MHGPATRPVIFRPHANLSDIVNRNIVRSEIEGGVDLRTAPAGAVFEIRTENRAYRLVHHGWGEGLLSGHPQFCPTPVPVRIHGSTWGGSMIRENFIGRGMHMEFARADYRPVTTSRVLEVVELASEMG